MKFAVKAKEFFVIVRNDKDAPLASVKYDNYEAEIDLLGIIDAAGSVGEALEELKRRALEGTE